MSSPQPKPCTVAALIVAAGRGNRLGSDIPKQYLSLAGKRLLRYTVKPFVNHPAIDAVRVIIHPDDRYFYEEATHGLALLEPVIGGERRQDSVRMGLESLASLNPEKVLIHDGARPFVTSRLISHILQGLEEYEAVIPALPVTDTLKRVNDNTVASTLDRSNVYQVQTPQGFDYQTITKLHQKGKTQDFTDDAGLCEAFHVPVTVTTGSSRNVKITTRKDLERAENMLMSNTSFETRVGTGFDVHRFKKTENPEGNTIMLCGIPVPHDEAIEAHSDGDVGLHAIVDALLGTIGAGDIGSHFPPSDPQWKNAPSHRFLSHAAALVSEASGRIINVDVTLICERPKVGAYRDAMRHRIAEILAISKDRVSVKATTTEKLGFTGRKEGIAAQAVASISLPVRS